MIYSAGGILELVKRFTDINIICFSWRVRQAMTLKKIVELEGVSVASVSNVISGLENRVEAELTLTGFDGDGSVTANDALAVLRYSVGFEDGTNVGKPANV